jgi:lipopolysaccharide/colanic/teichoic acid biosynthesis glycosyltransferase
LRLSSMDELPQLINVLRGDMSLVGPRPIVEKEISRYRERYYDYLRARPGITGLWQVSGRNDVSYETRTELDQRYVRNWSMLADIVILLRTVAVVLSSKGCY